MLTIKELTVKNFMSVGNQVQAIKFANKNLVLVIGENMDLGGDDAGARNGTGKTTIINALSYVFFGEALTNIRRDNLVNKTNEKGMLVSVKFEKNNIEYTIERGRKPQIFKFYANNIEQNVESNEAQGENRETQLEINKLMGMTHAMFKNIIALNTYTQPFLSLHHSEQQDIIEQLLGIQLLSEKADILKTKIKRSKEDIAMETARLDGLKISNQKVEETINSLQSKSSAWTTQNKVDKEKLEDSIKEIESLDIDKELEAHQTLEQWNKLNDEMLQLNKDRSNLEATIVQADKTAKKLDKDLEKLNEKATCYACGQDLPKEKIEEMQRKLEEEYGEANSYVMDLQETLDQTEEKIKNLGDMAQKPTTYYETVKEAYEHRQYVDTLKTALKNKQDESNPYLDQIDELQKQAIQEVNYDTVNTMQKLKEHEEFLYKLLTNKDSFIRKKIIDQNLTFLNNRLTHYLDQLGLPHLVTFKNDLSVEITQLGQDLDFDNLSRGERNRLILGMSFAFRDVWENLYQNINLLFLDELIDSGMDTAGVESALAILKKMSRERAKNIFLISHKDELIGRVNNVLRVVKENGFTQYANDVETYEHSR